MNLTGVIAEVREKYPNGPENDSLIRKADIIQKRIYRKLKKQNYENYDLITGQSKYPLTVDINSVIQVDVRSAVSGKFCKYPKRKVPDITGVHSKYHYFVSDAGIGDWIGLYPAPTDNEDLVTVYYYEAPENLVNINSIITLYENYRMMLVYGICADIAENNKEIDIATRFTDQYNDLEFDLLSLGKESDVLTVRNEMGW